MLIIISYGNFEWFVYFLIETHKKKSKGDSYRPSSSVGVPSTAVILIINRCINTVGVLERERARVDWIVTLRAPIITLHDSMCVYMQPMMMCVCIPLRYKFRLLSIALLFRKTAVSQSVSYIKSKNKANAKMKKKKKKPYFVLCMWERRESGMRKHFPPELGTNHIFIQHQHPFFKHSNVCIVDHRLS
jgi:hypothetical protein